MTKEQIQAKAKELIDIGADCESGSAVVADYLPRAIAFLTAFRNDILEEAAVTTESDGYKYDPDAYANLIRALKTDTSKGE